MKQTLLALTLSGLLALSPLALQAAESSMQIESDLNTLVSKRQVVDMLLAEAQQIYKSPAKISHAGFTAKMPSNMELVTNRLLAAYKLGNSEALVVKPELASPKALAGKRIAVPFTSTTHYSLLAALRHWGVDPASLQIVNLQPPAIIAAWQRGDIDGAYVWAPALNELAKEGKVLTDSAQVGEWGAPTLDVWVVRKEFAKAHPEVVQAFVNSTLAAQRGYLDNPAGWLAQPDNLAKLATLSGVRAAEVPGLVKGNTYLTARQQSDELAALVNRTIVDTARFLKEQGKVQSAGNDYSQYVTDRFVKAQAR